MQHQSCRVEGSSTELYDPWSKVACARSRISLPGLQRGERSLSLHNSSINGIDKTIGKQILDAVSGMSSHSEGDSQGFKFGFRKKSRDCTPLPIPRSQVLMREVASFYQWKLSRNFQGFFKACLRLVSKIYELRGAC